MRTYRKHSTAVITENREDEDIKQSYIDKLSYTTKGPSQTELKGKKYEETKQIGVN